eukprot:3426107-Prymnesium_polylepis.1
MLAPCCLFARSASGALLVLLGRRGTHFDSVRALVSSVVRARSAQSFSFFTNTATPNRGTTAFLSLCRQAPEACGGLLASPPCCP